MERLLLDEVEDAAELAEKLRQMFLQREPLRKMMADLSTTLRTYTWEDMSKKIYQTIHQSFQAYPVSSTPTAAR